MKVDNGTTGSAEEAMLKAALNLVDIDVDDPTLDLDSTLSRFTAATDIIQTKPVGHSGQINIISYGIQTGVFHG